MTFQHFAIRIRSPRWTRIEPLEARIAPAFVNPFSLGSLNGTSGFHVSGLGGSAFGERPAEVAGDVNGDGFEDVIFGAANAAFVVFGRADGFPPELSLAAPDGVNGFRIDGTAGSLQFGAAVSGAGDVNGDGFADLIVGAPNEAFGANNNAGAAYVIFGKAAFAPTMSITSLDGTNGFKLSGIAKFDQAGSEVGTAGDLNGDGLDDVVVSALGADHKGSASGSAYVIFGQPSGFPADSALGGLFGANGIRIDGAAASDIFGSNPTPAGDVNGDGLGDLIVGAQLANANGADSGAAYVVFGRTLFPATSFSVSTLDGTNGFRISGAAAGDKAGFAVGGGGDVNGDGLADVVIGAFDAKVNGTSSGAAYVVFGKGTPFGANVSLATLNGADGFRLLGEGANSIAGYSVDLSGDVNGDGFDDVIVGAPGQLPGSTYVVYGRAAFGAASLSLSALDGTNGVRFLRAANFDASGTNVAAGDVNGDGIDDLVSSDVFGGHIVFGSPSPAVSQLGDKNANTLTGDAAANILIGGAAGDTLIGNAGADVLLGGQGDDVLGIGGTEFRRVDGGLGRDTLRFDGAGLGLDLAALPDQWLTGIERFDFSTGAHFLSLNQREVLNLSPSTNTITILGEADDFVDFGPGWLDAGLEVIDGTMVRTFFNGRAVLHLAEAIGHSRAAGFALDRPGVEGGFTAVGESANDAMGRAAAIVGDVNGDGFDDVLLGAYRADTAGVFTGAAYLVFGKAGGFNPTLDLAALNGANGVRIRGLPPGAVGAAFARSVGAAGDVNGDGFADFIVSMDAAPPNATGAAFVIFGRAAFSAEIDVATLNGATGFRLSGAAQLDFAGGTVGTAGDVNGDGFSDLFIAATGSDAGAKDSGAAYIVFGKAAPFAADVPLASLDGTNGFRIAGGAANDFLGGTFGSRNPAAGDVNGDGFGDIIVGARAADANGKDSGAAYLIFGKASGFAASLSVKSLDGANGFQLRGAAAGDYAGAAASGAGDVNGDGFADLIVGATGADPNGAYTGASYVVFGKAAPFAAKLDLASLDGTNGVRLNGPAGRGVFAGYSAVGAGDVNGDGFDDLLISGGATLGANGFPGETAYVVFGRAGGFGPTFELSQINGQNGLVLGQFAGTGVTRVASAGGDVNGDGFDDLVVGSWLASSLGRTMAGQAHVFFGRDTGAVTGLGDAGVNTLVGNSFGDVLVAGQAGDTLLGNGGPDAMRGGQGDDLLAVADLDFMRLAGGLGTDTLRLDGAGLALNLTTLANTRLHGIEQIDLTGSGANTLTLSVREVLNLSPSSNTLTVLGDADDFVTLGAGWVQEVNQTIGPTEFEVFTSGAATLRIAVGVKHSLPSGYTLPTFDGTTGFAIAGAGPNDQARIVGRVGDVNGDGFDDFLVGAPVAAPHGPNSGTAYVIFGRASGFTSPVNLGTLNGTDGFAILGEAANDLLGFDLSDAGDFNGDGFGDIILASRNVGGAGQAGSAYVIYGKGTPFDPALELSSLNGANGFKVRVSANSVLTGVRVASAGDVNGDGFGDVVIGAPDVTTGTLTQKGAAYVIFGRAAPFQPIVDLIGINGTNGFAIEGTKKFELLGQSVSGGDVNGDGFSDVIVGTSGSTTPHTFVVFGKATPYPATMPDTALNGTNGFTLTGVSASAVSAAGDVNSDGLGDLIVGARFASAAGTTSGSAFVVFGKTSATFGKTVDLTKLNGTNGFQIVGREPGGYAGTSVSAAGDVNGDGFDDVIIGAPFTDQRGFQNGEAYVIYGAPAFSPSLSVGALDGTNGFSLVGTDFGTRAAQRVSGAGDVNGDGFDDVLVGSYGVLSGSNAPGRSYLILGFDSGKVTQLGDANPNMFTATAAADVIVTGQNDDTVTNAGTGDVLRGGQGDDRFSFTGPALKRLIGGHGFDTLELTGGLLLDLTARPVYRINGFEQVDLRPGANGLSLDARGVLALSPDTNTLIVRANLDDIVNIGTVGPGGWTATGSEVIDGDTFTVLEQGAAILKVSTFIAPVVTLVNATTATYTDVDGDLVTIKVSKGVLGVSDFFLKSAGTVGGAQLVAVNFSDDGTEFLDSDLTITAKRTATGGDGRVNVGRIEAGGIDLGKVTIAGDLAYISVGDTNSTTPAIDALKVGSIGVFGTSTGAGALVGVFTLGRLGTLNVTSDVVDATISAPLPIADVAAGKRAIDAIKIGGSLRGSASMHGIGTLGGVGSIEIGQDIRGGAAAGSASISINGDLGSLTLGGSMVGGGGLRSGSVQVLGAIGAVKIGGDLDGAQLSGRLGIKSVDVTGSVLSASIFAGYANGLPDNADAAIGPVTVDGDWVASNLVAGVQSSDPLFGNGGETRIAGGGDPAKIASIKSIAIGGMVLGTVGGVDYFGFVAEEVGSFSVGGTKFPLTKGASNDTTGLAVGATFDVKVREVGTFPSPIEGPGGGSSGFPLGSLDGTNGFRFDGGTNAFLGHDVAAAGDVNGDGIDDVIVGARGGGANTAGEVYVIFGKAAGFDPAIDPADLDGTNGFRIFTSTAPNGGGPQLSLGLGGAGDVNNDGFADVIVGSIVNQGLSGMREEVFVIFGQDGQATPFAASIDVNALTGANGFKMTRALEMDPNLSVFYRMDVAGAGDVNGDSFDDLVIGAVNADFNGQNSGSAYVVFSPGATPPASIDLGTLNGTNGFRVDGPSNFANLGYSVSAAGDINGDGFADVVLGATNASNGGNTPGAGYVVFGKSTAFSASFTPAALNGTNGFRIPAIDANSNTGHTVSGGGDVNGDGIDDLVIGAPYAYDGTIAYPGKSYVIFGKNTAVSGTFAADFNLAALNGTNGFKLTGESEYDYAGRAAIAGDINGDGLADIIIGAIGLDATFEYKGGGYIVFGSATPPANVALGSLSAASGFKFLGGAAADLAGTSVAAAGDVNDDGRADFIVGATGTDTNGSNSGAAYIVFDGATGPEVQLSSDRKTAMFTDVDGDIVTVKTTKGAFVQGDFSLSRSGIGTQLQLLDLTAATHPLFAGANLTFSAKRGPLGGDGFVNVGAIDATGLDLGSVSIDGDLGQLDAGDGTPAKQALVGLTVQSLGRLGLSTQLTATASLESNIAGKLGKLAVKSDIVAAAVRIAGSTSAADDDTGSITVGGSLRGGAATNSGLIFAGGDLGAVKIGGSVIGGGGPHSGSIEAAAKIASVTVAGSLLGGAGAVSGSLVAGTALGAVSIGGDVLGGRVFAKGNLLPTSAALALAIKSVAIEGSVRSASLFAGYDRDGAPANADVQIGAVTIGRDWMASSLVAGAQTGADGFFGNGDEPISGGTVVARIASIVIKGQALGSATPTTDHFGFVARQIGSFKVGSTKFPLAGTGGQSFAVGATGDLAVAELP